MSLSIIAIDPGKSGGIAFLNADGASEACNMPETPKDLCEIFDAAFSESLLKSTPLKAYVEEVGGYLGQAQPASAAFVFGQGYGEIIGILTHARIPFELVRPQKWQKALSLGKSGTPKGCDQKTRERYKREWKHKLREVAQRLFPHLDVTLAKADALLILEYGRRLENVTVKPPPGVAKQWLPGGSDQAAQPELLQ
jgi:hypothetical protein